jgi:hypothetical protein
LAPKPMDSSDAPVVGIGISIFSSRGNLPSGYEHAEHTGTLASSSNWSNYPVVMTNSLTLKDPPFLSSVNHLFLWAIYTMAMLNNQRVICFNQPVYRNIVGTWEYWLVVDLPLWKIWKSVGIMTFPIYGKIKNVPNHQPYHIYWTQRGEKITMFNTSKTLGTCTTQLQMLHGTGLVCFPGP